MKHAIEVVNVFKKYPIERIKKQRKKTFRILTDGLPKTSRIQALGAVTIRIRPGECVGIIGRNGSGKSTLLGTIAGILKPDQGHVHTLGKIISILDTKLGKPELTGEENRTFLSALFGMSRKEIHQTKNTVFAKSNLARFAHTSLLKYSRGMKDRLVLCTALCAKPDILLLDEVLAESDHTFRTTFANALRDLSAKGKTILFISHELALIENLCTRTIWLDKGKVRMDGRTQVVLQKYTEAN